MKSFLKGWLRKIEKIKKILNEAQKYVCQNCNSSLNHSIYQSLWNVYIVHNFTNLQDPYYYIMPNR